MVASMAAMAAGAFQRSNQVASNGFTEQRLPAHRGRARQICEATVGCRQSSWDRRNLTSSLRGANRFETMPLLDGRVISRVEQRTRLPVTSIVSNGGSHFASGLRLLMLTRMVPEAVRRNMAKRYLNSRGNCNTPDWGISFVAPELSFFCIVLVPVSCRTFSPLTH